MENSSIGIPAAITQDYFTMTMMTRKDANDSSEENLFIFGHDKTTGPKDPNDWTRLIVYGGVMGVLNVMGIITNFITIYVFTRYRTKSSTILLLQILAFADAVFLIFNTIRLSFRAIHIFVKSYDAYLDTWVSAKNLLDGFGEISRDYAVWMVALVTIDRYFGICHPMKATSINTPRHALLAAGSLLILLCAFNVPMFLLIRIVTRDPVMFDSSDLAKDKTFDAFYFGTDATVNLLVPIVLVITMNTASVCALTKARQFRSSMRFRNSDKVNGSYRTNIMLVVVAIVFVLCEVPKIVEEVVYFTGRELTYTEQKNNIPFPICMTSEFLQNLGSFVNFYIYCLVGKKFRRILVSGVRRSIKCCGDERSIAHKTHTSFTMLSTRKKLIKAKKKRGSQSSS